MPTALCALIAALAFGAASQPPQYFAVRVTDVDEAVEWYRTVFGLEGIGGSEAEDGRWRIENLRNDALFVEIVRDDRAQEAERASGFGKVGFFVPDLEMVADRAEQAAARTTMGPWP
jgi:catechol 2,3-dioxygenase-like lactoylglutathione lyase family enzyme